MYTSFKINNKIDEFEKNILKDQIEDFDGIYEADINLNKKVLNVNFNEDVITEDEIKENIELIGYNVRFN